MAAEAGWRGALDWLLNSARDKGILEFFISRSLHSAALSAARVQDEIYYYAASSGQEQVAKEALQDGACPLVEGWVGAH